jgi:pilus assembly protein Flp/PilA
VIDFWRDQRGATAIEVGMIVALISVALMGVLGALSGSLGASFTSIVTRLDAVNAAN